MISGICSVFEQDDWSLNNPTFGDSRQLVVVGWKGKSLYNKKYIVFCAVCSKDSELFGDGLFSTLKSSLISGSLPCGCSKRVSWTKEQLAVLCKRKAEHLGHTFLDFSGDYQGKHTKIKLYCKKHKKEWDSTTVNNLLNKNASCRECAKEVIGNSSRKSDEDMIASFNKSAQFPEGTVFTRANRLDSSGHKTYWNVACPECKTTNEAYFGSLQNGHRPCLCSTSRQKEAYVHLIKDGTSIIGVKFGIANKTQRRLTMQKRTCRFDLENFSIWSFDDKLSCTKAERECKRLLVCGIVSKQDMPDGYTETTYLYNLEKIVEIYEIFGGVRL